MARFNKNLLAAFKGKNVVFKRVKSGEDLKVEVTDRFPDYKAKLSNRKSHKDEVIKVKIVDRLSDVKIEIVDRFEDFTIYLD